MMGGAVPKEGLLMRHVIACVMVACLMASACLGLVACGDDLGVHSERGSDGICAITEIDSATAPWKEAPRCAECHAEGQLRAKTVNSHVLRDASGQVANPHALPRNGGHRERFSCTTCHIGHTEADPAYVRSLCAFCHRHAFDGGSWLDK